MVHSSILYTEVLLIGMSVQLTNNMRQIEVQMWSYLDLLCQRNSKCSSAMVKALAMKSHQNPLLWSILEL